MSTGNPLHQHLAWAIRQIEYDTCTHESTHRAGVLWTVCDACGAKWADDQGGFKPYVEDPKLTAAREALQATKSPAEAPQAASIGMTLRQHYAAQAMVGILAGGDYHDPQFWSMVRAETVAVFARKCADALLKETTP